MGFVWTHLAPTGSSARCVHVRHIQRREEELEADGDAEEHSEQQAEAVLRRAPPTHPNTEVVQGLSANVLRAHYRASFQKDPGQMGKARLKAAFLRPGAPRIGEEPQPRGIAAGAGCAS